ncbi:MAG TPA: phosphoribosylformylglycinamidine synthase, partial [Oscillospiraceae bacterium]|nr:phosphoribosylformylglycinamidine synthase [Oscillospiraceae bacterium]
MVYRVYVEKKQGFNNEAKQLLDEFNNLLSITTLTGFRVVNRYDVEDADLELFKYAKKTVFSDLKVDNVYDELSFSEKDRVFAAEYLPGQFNQRANSAAECIQIISQKERPLVKTAKIYICSGNISDTEFDSIKKHLINPIESRETSLAKPETLKVNYNTPSEVETLSGFISKDDGELKELLEDFSLAMDFDDLKFCQNYFIEEKRDPTITEIRMIDTYWSDHCRHTTFLTAIDNVSFYDKEIQKTYEEYLKIRQYTKRVSPINLMDIATICTRYLKKEGKLPFLDESFEVNACTVKIKVDVDGVLEDWLLLFKNETHNHPTEIEPFGGAATCIGGAIRDPLSGRAYVYAAMRITGAGNPLAPINETLKGKLPQRKIVTTAAAGYSSYGNQIGAATGLVNEIYHDGYIAKRMELGAVIGAVPAKNVRRETPIDGDAVILIGGKTGRDGCGGATGSSKSHDLTSLEDGGAEVQKGNAPEERKLQRLFRNKEASLLIKRCNDFGAGGISVAIGELADGIEIDLNVVKKKYEALDGTELAISESQERMAVVVDKGDVNRFLELAADENLEATVVATIKNEPRLIMNWNGKSIVDIHRDFLSSNGAEKHIDIAVDKTNDYKRNVSGTFSSLMRKMASDLNVCSQRGLSERFDSTAGANTVLMPFGGKHQLTPAQAMAHTVSTEKGSTDTCSLMAFGYNPFIMEKSPYHGAYLAVIESVSKLVASGASFNEVYLTFQEYFEKLGKDAKRWGKPLSALLGAFKAQTDLGIAAIGGKDSMSGSFENLDVPPTLVSFAVTTEKAENIVSPEFKKPNQKVCILKPEYDENGLPNPKSLLEIFNTVHSLISEKSVTAIYTPVYGGIAEGVMKMCFGNKIGFSFDSSVTLDDMFGYNYGAFILELNKDLDFGKPLGMTTNDSNISYGEDVLQLESLLSLYENKLEPVFPSYIKHDSTHVKNLSSDKAFHGSPAIKTSKPKVLIPVFPGTSCEYETAKALT